MIKLIGPNNRMTLPNSAHMGIRYTYNELPYITINIPLLKTEEAREVIKTCISKNYLNPIKDFKIVEPISPLIVASKLLLDKGYTICTICLDEVDINITHNQIDMKLRGLIQDMKEVPKIKAELLY